MESIIFEDSPLAAYLEAEGGNDDNWASARDGDGNSDSRSSSPSPSFAPRGRPNVSRVQSKLKSIPQPLQLRIPERSTVAAIHKTCSKAVKSTLGRADNARFLEQFRYIIVASQLLNEQSYHGHVSQLPQLDELSSPSLTPQLPQFSVRGVVATASAAFTLAWLVHWARGTGEGGSGRGARTALVATVFGGVAVVAYAFVRRQWLKYLRQRTLEETSTFVTRSQGLSAAMTASITLVAEVELVSRGYRVSTPMPPVSRLEDRSHTRRCARLRKTLHRALAAILPVHNHACQVLKPLAEEMDLEKYYDIYDVSELDISEAMSGYKEGEFEDFEALKVIKILAARFHVLRKVFLCCLLALNADGARPDFPRWSTALEQIEAVSNITALAEDNLRRILDEVESFAIPATPKMPLTPNRERHRMQLRKLNSLSSGIRGLQAKLHVLREESDATLDESEDVTDLGATSSTLMAHYESIGVDLKSLMQEWEDGKAALANNIDRNEKRISSISGFLSPAISLSGLTAVEEGSAEDALRALNGENRRSSMSASSEDPEEFEAVASDNTRKRSTFTREERIRMIKEDRVKRESMRDKADASTNMLRELESVINLRPRARLAPGQGGRGPRITSI